MHLFLTLYLLTFALAAWLLLFPPVSTGRYSRVDPRLLRRYLQRSLTQLIHAARLTWRITARHGRALRMWLRTHLTQSGLTIALLCLPAAIVLMLNRPALFEFQQQQAMPHPTVHALLNGERLVVPTIPPPDIFKAREVEHFYPDVSTANRDWQQLDPIFQQRLLAVFTLMRVQHGYEMILIEGYRSPERQHQLASLGAHVTRAGAHMSYHQYGLAADCAFLRNGRIVISEQDPWAMRGYELFGQLATEAGLTWGGHWSLRDYGHVELRSRRLGMPDAS